MDLYQASLPPMVPWKMELAFSLQNAHGDSHEKKHDGRVSHVSHMDLIFSASST